MAAELSDYNVDVCCWKVATVSTKMTKYAKGFMTMKPWDFAEAALSRCTSGMNAGCFKHDILYSLLLTLMDIVPRWLIIKIAAKGAKKGADRIKAREVANDYQ